MKNPLQKGNYISEWFGQRIFPEVRLDSNAVSGANWSTCPFLSRVKRETTECIKVENALGVCTINSIGNSVRKDWLVCPYRVIDSEIVRGACAAIFGASPSLAPIPISIINDEKGRTALNQSLFADGRAFIFFQDKLGGEISINGTPSSPEISFDIPVVELSQPQQDSLKIDRYGFIEIQTMDFHSRPSLRRTNRGHRSASKGLTSRTSSSAPSIRPS
jgi:hypothetical protein